LAKCPEWEDASGEVELDVSAGKDSPPRTALSVAYALAQQAAKWDVACLTFPSSHLRDRVKVSGKCAAGEVFFFADPSLLKKFWRAVFSFERVAEAEFYEVCRRAFPDLIFHRDLSFGRFEGTYANLRDQVVNALTALNDEFLRAYRTGNGVSREIQATMGAQGVEVSPESPNTRGSERLMRLRDVTHDGRVYRCEWHAKLEPNRNRIHFWVPSVNEGDKLIIGKFVVHLAT
jgi:hypothetical protein